MVSILEKHISISLNSQFPSTNKGMHNIPSGHKKYLKLGLPGGYRACYLGFNSSSESVGFSSKMLTSLKYEKGIKIK